MKLLLIILTLLLSSCANTNSILINRTDSIKLSALMDTQVSVTATAISRPAPLYIIEKKEHEHVEHVELGSEVMATSGFPESTNLPKNGSTRYPVVSKTAVKKPLILKSSPDSILDKLKLASMAFSVPDVANIQDDIIVQLLIDPIKNENTLAKELSTTGNAVTSKVLVSKILDAKIAATDFTITKITPERQAIADTVPTEWLWELSATKSGIHDVHLTITAIVDVDGVKAERHIKTFEKVVKIEITNKQLILEFISKYWQWLWTVLLFPVVTLLWKKVKNKGS